MASIDATQLLRPGVLDGVAIVLAEASPAAPPPRRAFAAAVQAGCAALGARVAACGLCLDGGGQEGPVAAVSARGEQPAPADAHVEAAVERALAQADGAQVLVVDGASLFAWHAGAGGPADATGEAGERGRRGLRGCLQASWSVTRALATRALLPAAEGERGGGRIVYIAPPADAGEHADAARAGLENLARTLSIEWARHAVTTVAIAPRGDARAAGEVAALAAYLASAAGAYFSGCLLDLRGPG